MSNLGSVLQRYTDKVEPKYPEIPGIIGIVLNGSKTVEVPSRGQFLYVRLRANTSEFVTAYNDKVFPGYDLPVIVQWKHGRYEIVRRDSERYTDWETENPYLPKHGAVHSMNVDGGKLGSDPVWVYPYNFMPALVSPFFDNNALNVYINPQYINFRGTWRYIGNTGTPSLSTYNPVSGSCIILVTIDGDSGNPALFISSGTYIPSSVTGSVELTQYVPTFDAYRYLPLSFVVIQSGTTRINWGNLHDVRQFVGNMVGSTGTASAGGGGISGISIQDEGIPKGTGTVLNFVGVNVDVSVSGTVARVFVTGSTGGGSIPTFVTGSVPYAGGNGVLKESNEWLNFDEDSATLWAGRKLTYSGIQYSDFRYFARATGTNSVVAIGGIAIGTGSLGSPSMTLNGYKARGTFAAPTPVQNGDALLTLIGNGYDGVTWQNASRVRLYAEGNWITGAHTPTRVDVDVVPSGSATRRTQFQVYGDNVNIPTGSTYNIGGIPHTHTGRSSLTGNRTYYVRTDGNDSNDGLSNTSSGAFLTINKAIQSAAAVDMGQFSITIQIGNGTYAEEIIPLSYVGAGPITIIGSETTPNNVKIAPSGSSNCITMSGVLGKYRVRGLKLQPPASSYGILLEGGSFLEYQNIDFAGSTTSFSHMANRNSSIVSTGNSTISAGSIAHTVTSDNGWTTMRGENIIITGTPNFTNYYAFATRGGVLLTDTFIASGSATGKKYDITLNGVIQAAGSTIPGDVAGTSSSGGQFV